MFFKIVSRIILSKLNAFLPLSDISFLFLAILHSLKLSNLAEKIKKDKRLGGNSCDIYVKHI